MYVCMYVCHAEPNSIYCIQEKNNRMYLVQQGSGLATAQHINWVLNHFFGKDSISDPSSDSKYNVHLSFIIVVRFKS